MTVGNDAWYVWSNGDVVNGGFNVTSSYGRNDRRTRTTPAMRIWSTLLVTPTSTAATVSSLPTGEKSPDSFMYYNHTSFYVMEDGSMITHAVKYSYGKLFGSKFLLNNDTIKLSVAFISRNKIHKNVFHDKSLKRSVTK